MEQGYDPFSTSVHLDLLSGVDETEIAVFTFLDYLRYCPHANERREEILESYGITEEDVRKYYQAWLNQ